MPQKRGDDTSKHSFLIVRERETERRRDSERETDRERERDRE